LKLYNLLTRSKLNYIKGNFNILNSIIFAIIGITKVMKSYHVSQIADWVLCYFRDHLDDSVSPLKLQKLLYYCQAWHLAILECPLFEEDFQAWMHGPVIPSLYHQFKDYGFNSINCPPELKAVDLADDTHELLIEVMDKYGEHTARYLELLTHQEEPWLSARGNRSIEERCGAVIDKETMKRFYQKLNASTGNE